MFWHQTFRLVLDWRGSERSILRRKVAIASFRAVYRLSERFVHVCRAFRKGAAAADGRPTVSQSVAVAVSSQPNLREWRDRPGSH